METTDKPLAGQVAVVTGAGRGIGKAISHVFAAAGATVVAAARTDSEVKEVAKEIVDMGGKATSMTVDVTDEASVNALAAAVTAEFGGAQIVINNAGTHNAIGPIWEVSPADWWKDVETSLLGPFLMSRAFLPGMLAAKTGRIINLSSGAATEPRPFSSAYTAAKTGAQRFTESVHRSLEGTGVLMFSLNPGPVLTPMNIRNQASEAGKKWYPGQRTMNYFPAEKAAGYALILASGRGDALGGRFVSTFDDLEEVITQADVINANDLRRLAIRGD